MLSIFPYRNMNDIEKSSTHLIESRDTVLKFSFSIWENTCFLLTFYGYTLLFRIHKYLIWNKSLKTCEVQHTCYWLKRPHDNSGRSYYNKKKIKNFSLNTVFFERQRYLGGKKKGQSMICRFVLKIMLFCRIQLKL